MKRYSEVASRYASALFQVSDEGGKHKKVFADIRALADLFSEEGEVSTFIQSPIVQPADREAALAVALNDVGVCDEVKNVVLLLAKKGRLSLFDEIVLAFQDREDLANGVTRGMVRSACNLTADDRSQIEEIVKKATGKSVILTYKVDPAVIGGLVAQVGSYSFDDSIDTHLRRMKEELNRRAH